MEKEFIEIYTDMSLLGEDKTPSSFGIGIFTIHADESEFKFRENIKFDDISDIIPVHRRRHTDDLEMYAVYRALKMNRLRKLKHTELIVYTDSSGLFSAYHGLCKSDKINTVLLDAIKEQIQHLSNNIQIDLRCIKGHVNVYGNNKVDKLARKSMVI